ncbi:nucleoside deaminase [Paenibacillus allorhizosphaerae]|uniref:tRNA-specific adenosine deaminase n=1 Tax=Paenibacillus allorhizosphaerae TaxID=2849866 RepID=A0ABN7TRC6_9BACL|nr:nucleoside deaminase [Paenibacillus allorhizosphaerae]CAG7644468.1 tRNA-specific adenosine deaminase [Paenibacillus allorhizosphaerae]
MKVSYAEQDHVSYLLRCVQVSRVAKNSGNFPFGAILVDSLGNVLLEQGNIEITENVCTGHAETMLMEAASRVFSKSFLWNCTLYTTVEPCAMCAGSIYWGNVGRVVYGISEQRLAQLTGDDSRNLTLDLPCREVFARGRKPIEVMGPFPEIEEETITVHENYWKQGRLHSL